MSATLLGALATAGILGVTHAIEPDHVAGISSVTAQYGDSRLSALVGACFSLGHVALVVVWLATGYLLLGRTEYPAVFDTVGTASVAALLSVLGVAMAIGGLRSLRHTHAHEHDGEVHSHPHVHLPAFGPGHDHDAENADGHDHDSPDDSGVVPHAHGHGVGAYLKTGVVGALFTLSPPLSMILFASTLFADYGGGVVAGAVVAYAVTITATMSALGAGVGVAVGATATSPRLHGAARLAGGILVTGFAVSMLTGLPTPAGLSIPV